MGQWGTFAYAVEPESPLIHAVDGRGLDGGVNQKVRWSERYEVSELILVDLATGLGHASEDFENGLVEGRSFAYSVGHLRRLHGHCG